MRLIKDDTAATASEYALIICFIAVLLALGVGVLGPAVQPPLARIAAALNLGGGGDAAAAAAASTPGEAAARSPQAPAAAAPETK